MNIFTDIVFIVHSRLGIDQQFNNVNMSFFRSLDQNSVSELKK